MSSFVKIICLSGVLALGPLTGQGQQSAAGPQQSINLETAADLSPANRSS
jgi:hypothetical protein